MKNHDQLREQKNKGNVFVGFGMLFLSNESSKNCCKQQETTEMGGFVSWHEGTC